MEDIKLLKIMFSNMNEVLTKNSSIHFIKTVKNIDLHLDHLANNCKKYLHHESISPFIKKVYDGLMHESITREEKSQRGELLAKISTLEKKIQKAKSDFSPSKEAYNDYKVKYKECNSAKCMYEKNEDVTLKLAHYDANEERHCAEEYGNYRGYYHYPTEKELKNKKEKLKLECEGKEQELKKVLENYSNQHDGADLVKNGERYDEQIISYQNEIKKIEGEIKSDYRVSFFYKKDKIGELLNKGEHLQAFNMICKILKNAGMEEEDRIQQIKKLLVSEECVTKLMLFSDAKQVKRLPKVICQKIQSLQVCEEVLVPFLSS